MQVTEPWSGRSAWMVPRTLSEALLILLVAFGNCLSVSRASLGSGPSAPLRDLGEGRWGYSPALTELPVQASLWVYGCVRVDAGPSGSCGLELACLLEPGCPEQYSGEAAAEVGSLSLQAPAEALAAAPRAPWVSLAALVRALENVIQREGLKEVLHRGLRTAFHPPPHRLPVPEPSYPPARESAPQMWGR